MYAYDTGELQLAQQTLAAGIKFKTFRECGIDRVISDALTFSSNMA